MEQFYRITYTTFRNGIKIDTPSAMVSLGVNPETLVANWNGTSAKYAPPGRTFAYVLNTIDRVDAERLSGAWKGYVRRPGASPEFLHVKENP